MSEFFGQKKTVMLQVDENNPGYLKPAHKLEYGFFKLPFFANYFPVITMDDRTCWFPASLVAKYMGYSNYRRSVIRLVYPIYRTKLSNLINYANTGELDAATSEVAPSGFSYNFSFKDIPDQVFQLDSLGRRQRNDFTLMMEPGLYQLVEKSSLPQAVNFARWVYESIIPYAVRNVDQFTLNKYKDVIDKQQQIIEANQQYISKQQESYNDLLEERDALKAKLDNIRNYLQEDQ